MRIMGVSAIEDAIEKFHQQSFRRVVLTKGISAEQERTLRNLFTYQQPVIKIIRYRAGDSGILPLKIQEALDRRATTTSPLYHSPTKL